MVTVLIHPTANYLKRAPKHRRDALLRRLEECEDVITVLHKPGVEALVKGERIIYDKWPKNDHFMRGAAELARIVDKNERIILGGFRHHSCVDNYARQLARWNYKVTLKENLTDAALKPIYDTLVYRSYKEMLELGVNIDPPPVKRMFYVALARTHRNGPAIEASTYHRTAKKAWKALNEVVTDVDGSIMTTEVLYASGLKLG